MKRILCYGDSNTRGAIPGQHKARYDENTRYTKVLQKILGENYEVIEEGLGARTAVCDDINQAKGNKNGTAFFGQCVLTHDPLDYVVLFLGTNDMKAKFKKTVPEIAKGIEKHYIKFLNTVLNPELLKMPKLILIAPGEVKEGLFAGFEGAEKKSKMFNIVWKELAEKHKCGYVGNEILIAGSDGVHLTEESHKNLAHAIAKLIEV